MKHRPACLFTLCVSVILALTGCLPKTQASIPVTGAENKSVPAVVGQARENVLEYVISSTRLAAIPPSVGWQLEDDARSEGEYRFRSGDWLMVIQLAGSSAENQKIMIINRTEDVYWCGYVKPDGRVVDTAYLR